MSQNQEPKPARDSSGGSQPPNTYGDFLREPVVIVTDLDLIEGTICYPRGIRLSDALNAESAQLAKPHLPLVDASVTRIETGKELLRSRFLLVAREKIVVLLPRSEMSSTPTMPAADLEPDSNDFRKPRPQPRAPLRRETDVPALVRALKDTDHVTRRRAAVELAQLGSRGKSAVADLVKGLDDPDELVRGACAEAIGCIGAEARQVVPALRQLLKDNSEFVRRMAADALGNFGASAAAAVPDLSEALKDREEFVRRAAAGALGKVGAYSSQAAPALRAALADSDVLVRHWAAVALNKIEPRKPAPVN
jgi:hypothetical protein